MNDTDITPAPAPPPADDSTEQLTGPLATSRDASSESTFKSIAPDQSATEITLIDNATDDATEKSLPPPGGPHATMPPGDGSATDLIEKQDDTGYAALLPEQETFIPDAGVAPSAPAPPTPLGYPNVPGYEIIGTLGRGGMGVVYKARDMGLRRLVALKMILHGNLASPGDLSRFQIEAEAIARLQHPNIVQIYEIGTYQGLPFFSLEYVDGGSLGHQIAGMPQCNPDAARLIEILAHAMAFAHSRGIVHRDLKPANILLQISDSKLPYSDSQSAKLVADGKSAKCNLQSVIPKIVDFGLAKKLDDLSGQTHTGAIMGTPSYMSPEQASGHVKEIGPGADIYALGAILYEMLTGRPPFRAEKPMDTIRLVLQEEPVAPARLNPGVARDLETICLKCLQKEINKRYPTALELAEDLRRFREGVPILARPVTTTERIAKWVKRRPAMAAVYGLIFLATILGGVGGLLAWRWYETETARLKVESALDREKKALKQAEEANEKLEQIQYIHDINLAWRSWEAGDVVNARRLVNEYEKDEAKWEWWELNYLRRLVHPELSVLKVDREPEQVLFAPGDREGRIVDANHEAQELFFRFRSQVAFTPTRGTPVRFVAYSPDGKQLAAAGTDKIIYIWDLATAKKLHALKGHAGSVVHLAFSRDGARLASSSADKTVRVWDVTSGKDLQTLKGHGAEVVWSAFSSDGRQLASASWDTTARVWDTASGKELTSAPLVHADALTQVAYTPNGKSLVTVCADKTVKFWDAVKFTELPSPLEPPMEDTLQIAFSPDGSRVAFAKRDKTIKVFDLSTGKKLFFLQGHSDQVSQVGFSPDSEYLLSAGRDKSIRLWSAKGSREVWVLPGATDKVSAFAFNPRKHEAAVGVDRVVRVYDTYSEKLLRTLERHAAEVTQVTYSGDGRFLASGDADGVVKMWDASGQELLSLKGPRAGVQQLTFSHAYIDPPRELAAAGKDSSVHVWDRLSGKELSVIPGDGSEIVNFAIIPGLDAVVSINRNHQVRVSASLDGGKPLVLSGHLDKVTQLSRSRDEQWLATASWDKTVKIWDAKSGKLHATLKGHLGEVVAVAFSEDSNRLASGSWDKTVKVWDVATGMELLTLNHGEEVAHVVFSSVDSHGGSKLASVSPGYVKIWEGNPP